MMSTDYSELESRGLRVQQTPFGSSLTINKELTSEIARAAARCRIEYLVMRYRSKGLENVRQIDSLRAMNLKLDKVEDLSFLEEWTPLETLFLRVEDGQRVNLAKLSQLTYLDLENYGPEVTGVFENKRIIQFSHSYGDDSILDQIATTDSVESLFLVAPKLTDLSPLRKVTSLKSLQMQNMRKLECLAPLGELSGLKSLIVQVMKCASEFSFLRGLEQLQVLTLSSIEQRSPTEHLGGCKNLVRFQFLTKTTRGLSLVPAPLEALADLPELTHIDMIGSWLIPSLRPLTECPKLSSARIYGPRSCLIDFDSLDLLKRSTVRASEMGLKPFS